MGLDQQSCVPCRGGVEPMSAAEAQQQLPLVPGWQLRADGAAILRRVAFKNFAQALAFVNQVGAVCETEKHHADITFGWGYAEITVQTHAIGGLHPNDFILAAKINVL